jgi:putative chitinase
LRLAHFLAQCAHESGNFTVSVENLFYSAESLVKVFPKYFTAQTAPAYAKQPQKIANRVYANRMGNGPEQSGDGYRYCGRGYIQLTGKSNYMQFSTFMGENCVDNPQMIATKYPLASAAFFFSSNKLWLICDKGKTQDVVVELTKRINGGTIGLDDRLAKFNKFVQILGV